MATTVIDNRVVEMKFDNKDFEKNIQQSMTTLDKLKAALSIDSAKGLDQLAKASNSFSLNGIDSAIQTSKLSFSALQVAGVTAISKITSAAMDAGVKLVKSLSVDQITAGFDKYAQKTSAVQTIMAATGDSIGYITDQIDKLNWFTDETSYNLIDMTNNIAKFTSNGILLKDAVTQMQGIATAAALAGANSQDASHAMTGFSKAIAAGAMKRQNWQWIQTAHMDTMQFKTSLIEAAEAAGTLRKVNDGVWMTMAKHEVTLTNFEEAMKDGWITTKVMTSALEDYGNFSEVLYSSLQKLDNAMTTSELLDYLEDYRDGTLDIKKVADELDVSSEDLKSVLDDLNDSSLDLGNKAFRAAQEAKTFREAIDSVKDAVSTSWMTTFEMIFGNYEEAKKLWTGVANGMWEVFAAGGEKRNQVLGIWKELGGRDSLLRGVFTLLNSILKPLAAVKAAFASLFPSGNKGLAQMLVNLTEKFNQFAQKLTPSKEILEDIYWIFSGLFNVGKLVLHIFVSLVKALLPVTKPLADIARFTIHILAIIGQYATAISNFIIENGLLKGVIETVSAVLQKFGQILFSLLKVIGGGFALGILALVTAITKGVRAVKDFVKNSKVLTTVITTVQNGLSKVVALFTGFKKGTDSVTTTVRKAKTNFAEFSGEVGKSGTVSREAVENMTPLQKALLYLSTAAKVAGTVIVGAFTVVKTALSKVGSFFSGLFTNTSEFVSRVKGIIVDGLTLVKGIFSNIKEAIVDFLNKIGINTDDVKKKFEGVSGILNDFFRRITVGKVLAIAFAIALLYVSSACVKLVDSWTQVGKSASGLIGSIKGVFGGVSKLINTLDANLQKKTTFKEFAQSIALLSASLVALTYAISKDKDSFITAAITLGAMASAAFLLTWGLTKLSNSLSKNGLDNKFNSNARGMLVLAGAIGILSVAMMTITKIDLSGESFKTIVAKLGMLTAMIGILAGTAIVMSKLAPKLAKGGLLLISLALAMKVIMETMLLMTKEDFTGIKDNILDIAAVFGAFSIVTIAASKLHFGSAISLLATALALKLFLPSVIDLMKTIGDSSRNLAIKDKALSVLDSINNWIHAMIDKYGTFKGNLVALLTIAGSVGSVVALMIGAGAFLSGLAILADVFKGIGMGILGLALGFKIIVSAMEEFNKATKEMSEDSMNAFSDALLTFIGISALVMALVAVINGLTGIVGHLVGIEKLKVLRTNFAAVGVAFIGIGASVLLISAAVKVLSSVAKDTEGFNAAKDAVALIMLMLSILIASASLVKKAGPVIATFSSILVGISVILAELAVLALFKPEELIAPALTMVGIIFALAAMVHATSKINDAKKLKVLVPVIIMLAEIGATLVMLGKYKHAWYDYLSMGATMSMVILSVAGLLKIISSSSGLGSNTSTKKMQLLIPLIFVIGAVGASLGVLASYKHAWYEYLSMGAALSMAILSLAGMLKIISSIKVQNVGPIIAMLAVSALSMVAVAGALRLIADQEMPSVWSSLGALEVGLWSLVPLITIIAGMAKIMDSKALIGTIVLLVGVCGVLFSLAASLSMLADIDTDKLIEARNAMAIMGGVMAGLVIVAGAFQSALVAIGSALGSAAGGAIGAAAIPVLLLSIGLSVIEMASGLMIAAQAIDLLSGCLGNLVEPIQQLSGVDILGVSGGLAVLGLALIPLSLGMAAAGIACTLGAAGLGLLALALNAVGPAAESANTPLQTLSQIDLAGIGRGMLVMAVGGIALLPAAVGVTVFAAALNLLASAAEKLQNVKTAIANFSSDVATSMQAGSKVSTAAAIKAGLTTAAGYVFGFHEGGQWHSPPRFVVAFLDAVGLAIDDNGKVVAKASASGAEVGNSFGQSCLTTINGWISKIDTAMSGFKTQFGSATESGKGLFDSIKEATSGILPDFNEDLFDIESILEPINESINEMTEGLGGGTAAMDDFGDGSEKAGKKLKDVKDLISSVKDSVANLDIFSKFEAKTETTAEQLIENMKSNIDGVASWTHKLAVLAERGIDQALYSKLAEMGPQAYDTVNAFVQMTDEQLQEANQLFATSMTLPQSQADIVAAGFTYAGEMATQGFSNALDDHMAAHEAAHGLGQAAVDGLNESLQVASPSKVTYQSGMWSTMGLAKGILDNGAVAILKLNARMVARYVLTEMENILKPSATYNIGKNATQGLANGIGDSEAARNVLDAAGEIARKAYEKMQQVLNEHSPSKVTQQIGKFATMGLAIGITDAASNVVKAARSVGELAVSGMQGTIDQINDFMDLNLNPIITPILDLSYMEAQMQGINSGFAMRAEGAGMIQNGDQTTAPTSNGVTYIQNNYSPKELSRIDIYRNTKNQLSMIGKVVRANG